MNGERWTLEGLHCDPPPPECEFVLASDYDALAAELGDIKSSWTFTELPAAYDRMTDAERKAQARIAQLEAVLQAISQDEFRDEWKLSEEYIDDDYWRIVNIARVALTSAPETKAEYDAKDHQEQYP